MRTLLLIAFVLTIGWTNAQTTKKMKLNAGIITEKLQETKKFYTEVLDFGVSFENEFYLLLHTPNKSAEISFLQPNHPSHTARVHAAESFRHRLRNTIRWPACRRHWWRFQFLKNVDGEIAIVTFAVQRKGCLRFENRSRIHRLD